MAYRFSVRQSVPQDITRVVLEQIDGAIEDLSSQAIDPHEGVHEARKRFKMIRAVLRMIRSELGETYQKENAEFREFGKKLSAVRDAEAMIETFDKLKDRFKESLDTEAFSAVRDNLIQRRQTIADEEEDLGLCAQEVVTGLQEVRERVALWPLSNDRFEKIGVGLEKMYAQGRKYLSQAYLDPSAENFHEWRKRVKDLWYHCRLLRDVWPQLMDAYIETLHRLSDLLGDDHDLVVFRETLAARPELFGGADNVERLGALVDQRQQELRSDAQPIGRQIYAEKSRQFRSRMEQYWTVWRERTSGVDVQGE